MLRESHLFNFCSNDNPDEPRHLAGIIVTDRQGFPDELTWLADACFYFEPVDHADNLGSIIFDASSNVYYTTKADPIRSITSLKKEDFISIGRIHLSDYCKVDDKTTGTFVQEDPGDGDIFMRRVTPWCTVRIQELVRSKNGAVIDFERFLVTKFFERGIMKKLKAKYHVT